MTSERAEKTSTASRPKARARSVGDIRHPYFCRLQVDSYQRSKACVKSSHADELEHKNHRAVTTPSLWSLTHVARGLKGVGRPC